MTNFFWSAPRGAGWSSIYPRGCAGSDLWETSHLDVDSLQGLVTGLFRHRVGRAPQNTVFVSHRRSDTVEALRLAALIFEAGFDVWLDVLDPVLAGLGGSPGSEVGALAIACRIEMGLLNSDRLLALITPNTKGSQWVPYEYGRVKEDRLLSDNVASWIDDRLSPGDLPEYLYLCPRTHSDAQVLEWLALRPAEWLSYRSRPHWLPQ